MDQWKETVAAANCAYSEGRHADAEQLYIDAARRAAQFVSQWQDREAAVAMLSVSNQNLADLYFRQGRHPEALSTYGHLLAQLNSLRSASDGDPELAQFAERAWRRVASELSGEVRSRKLALPEDNPGLAQALATTT
ncbi:hypothetical protein PVT68_12240 [Microbulbifer bruguierae]|uniref:Tetratricopeptide repeat protein n=1 Tax=Microbulbifer bruguierae TaxID=3029061 RepID=A0ABY8N9F8_9GAMM|nr:hypothetical protein [Microbulbifer bruguierae]WGL15539.1 hypothetical protein PVT68_12240 [Microbulbifer bruguierae]